MTTEIHGSADDVASGATAATGVHVGGRPPARATVSSRIDIGGPQ